MRVIAYVPHPPDGASSRYRVYQMMPWLERSGVRLEVRPFLDQQSFDRLYRAEGAPAKAVDMLRCMGRRWRDLHDAKGFPVALIHREAWPMIGFAVDEWLESRGVGWVFDFDDAVFLPNVSAANRWFSRLKPFRQPAGLAARARAVAAGNAWLAEWARGLRPGHDPGQVEVIPTAVDTDLWRPVARSPGPPRLVWIGSPSTAPYLEPLRPALARLAARHPGLEFHVVGASFRADDIAVVAHRWSLETESAIASNCDIGLSPLPDSDWSRGKCGLKLLLYMALGLPAVASPVGVHRDILRHGENGWVAPTPEDFERGIDTLIGDPALRSRLGGAARATVEAGYSLKVVAPRLASLLERAAA